MSGMVLSLLCLSVWLRLLAAIYTLPLYKATTNPDKAVLEASSLDSVGPSYNNNDNNNRLPYERDNLVGCPGEGYYVQMAIGRPPQIVSRCRR